MSENEKQPTVLMSIEALHLQEVLNYLAVKPFKEVAGLIQLIHTAKVLPAAVETPKVTDPTTTDSSV